MKKILLSLCACFIAAQFSIVQAPAQSAGNKPLTDKDVLLMKHTLFSLWGMGLTSLPQMDDEYLYINSILYIQKNQFRESVEMRDSYPMRFHNIPERYDAFFPEALVEGTARNVFKGWLDKNVEIDGIFHGTEGYYVDFEWLMNYMPDDENLYLPGYTEITSLHYEDDGSILLNGKLRRFRYTEDGEKEILWGAATFMARFVPSENAWQLTSFVITEEGMG